MLDVQTRIATWLSHTFVSQPDGAAVAAVSHADVIKAALCHALGLSLDHHGRFEVSPGSVSTIVGGAWGMKVHSLNEVFA